MDMEEDEETFYRRDIGEGGGRERDRSDRDRSDRGTRRDTHSGYTSGSQRSAGSSHDPYSRDSGRREQEGSYESKRRDDRDRSDRRGGYGSQRDSAYGESHSSRDRNGGRERKRDRDQDYEMDDSSRDRNRRERSEREHHHRDRTGEGRSRGVSPSKRLRSSSPSRDSNGSRGRPAEFPASSGIPEEVDRKPRVKDLEDQMRVSRSGRPTDPEDRSAMDPRRPSSREETRRPTRTEEEERLEYRRRVGGRAEEEASLGLEYRRSSRTEEEMPDHRRPRLDDEAEILARRTTVEDPARVAVPGMEGRRGSRAAGTEQRYEPQRGDRYDNVRSRAIDLNSKVGTSGLPVELIANFFPMVTKPTWCLFNYRVDYTPEEERTIIKKRLLRVHNNIIGANIFDGSNMYTIRRLDPDPMILFSERETDKARIQLTLTLAAQIPPGDMQYLQFYNIIIRACMNALKFEELGRHFYDRHSAIKIPQHHLELWPGYITTLRNYENNLMLCVEVTHKVLRQETCLSIIYAQQREREFKDRAADSLIGNIVMTHYNRKTYRVDDIDWTKSPLSTFEMKGATVSLVDYYRTKYQLHILDMNQPLLVSRPKKKAIHRGDVGPILLVPELCQMTGLSEEIRKNYKTMRELSTYLQQAPDRRVENIQNFMRRLRCCTDVRELIAKWGLEFEGRLVPVRGRVAPTEQVIFRSGVEPEPVKVGPNADWTFAFKSKNMYASMRLTRWALIVTSRDSRGVDNLLHTMRTVGKTLDFEVGQPTAFLRLPDMKLQTFVAGINQVMSEHKHLDIIFFILPNQQLDLYSAIKKRCCLDYGIASQCFLSKHLQPNAKGLMSIVTKVVVQINAKLGGEPWATHNPLKASHTMIVGFDVYHCGKRKGASVGAMVATTNRDLSRYYSTVSFHTGREELSDRLCTDMTKCIYAFRSKNKDELPDRIIMYRDGVGEGQLSYVYNIELAQIKSALCGLYGSVGRPSPKFSLVICTKKGNARIFHKTGAGVRNPDAGTIVDNTITLPERYDFFLISQASRQGTVSPTTYNVIFDEQGLDPDKIQRLTFKLCHLYYNWSGTVAVPAVCQYAHKLAYLTGLALGNPAHERLAHFLYFL